MKSNDKVLEAVSVADVVVIVLVEGLVVVVEVVVVVVVVVVVNIIFTIFIGGSVDNLESFY